MNCISNILGGLDILGDLADMTGALSLWSAVCWVSYWLLIHDC